MSRLSAAIDVATEYAVHLHRQDGVPKEKAIQVAVDSVVRAVRSKPSKFVTSRSPKDAGVGFSGSAMMGAGSVLSALGWLRNIVMGG